MNAKEELFQLYKTVNSHYLVQYLKKNRPDLLHIILSEKTDYISKNISEKIYTFVNGAGSCSWCGNRTKFHNTTKGFFKFCSPTCSALYTARKGDRISTMKNTMKNNYTKEFIKEKMKKMKKTKLEIYGDKNYNGKEITKGKLLKNNFDELFTTDRLKNMVEPLFTKEEYKGNDYEHDYKFKCLKCGNIFEGKLYSGRIPRCYICNPKLSRTSKAEKEIQNWLSGFISIEKNKMFDKKYELDIYIPSKKFGIEFNGLFWHSEINGEKGRNYHLNKTEFFENQGIQILHIFEDEWIDKREIVKSIILSKLGLIPTKIFARKCQIKEISSADARLFYFDNHIQGEVNSKVNIGLYYQNELVSLMSFSKPRFNKNYDWEMTRFCTKVGVNVVGAAGRLLSHFKTTYKGTLISYADRRFSMGKLYEQLGFTKAKTSSPDYFYFKSPLKRFHRVQFQKHKLKEKLDIFDPQLTEWQNMQLNGWDRIWDCGNLVFILK
jgi:hypothetical protein